MAHQHEDTAHAMPDAITYDLARGLHVIAVIGWVAGMLMLPRFYSAITALAPNDPAEPALLQAAQTIRTLILTPFMLLAWAFGIFLFLTYFASDWDVPQQRLENVPAWFWLKVAFAVSLTAYHALLSVEGRRLARGERRRSQSFWNLTSVIAFLIAAVIVLLATLEP